MAPLKILHCIPTMGGGGAERQLCYLTQEMVRRGVEVHVALLHHGTNSAALVDTGAILHKLKALSNYDPRLVSQLSQLILNLRPSVIHTWLTQMDILAGGLGILTKTPFIVSERSSALCYNNSWKNAIRLLVGRKAAFVVPNSATGGDYWANNRKDSCSIKVIRNGIPFEAILNTPTNRLNEFGVHSTGEVIVYAGRYSGEKNLLKLIHALKCVLDARKGATAFFFGDGPLKEEILRERDKLNLGNRLKILGYSSKLWGILKRADVFVSPSQYEGAPNTVLEAVVCRCPVVISNITAHKELLTDAAATFVESGSIASICNGILAALEDTDGANRKAQQAFREISTWSVESAVQEYIDLYRFAAHRGVNVNATE